MKHLSRSIILLIQNLHQSRHDWPFLNDFQHSEPLNPCSNGRVTVLIRKTPGSCMIDLASSTQGSRKLDVVFQAGLLGRLQAIRC